MTKFKKSILTIGTSLTLLSPIAMVVSCGESTSKPAIQNESVALILDGGPKMDRSFNEGAVHGVESYIELESNKENSVPETYKIYNPLNDGRNKIDFTNQYNKADKSNPNSIMVVAGYKHGEFDGHIKE